MHRFRPSSPFGILAAGLLVLAGVVSTVWAAVLTPGSSAQPLPTIASPGGTLISTCSTTAPTLTFTGTLACVVVRNASGTLDFYYQWSQISGDSIHRFTMADFGGYATDAYQVTGSVPSPLTAGTVAPTSVDRNVGPANGRSIGFNFAPESFAAGSRSVVLLIRTNAFDLDTSTGNMAVIDGSALNATAFGPIGGTVTPTTSPTPTRTATATSTNTPLPGRGGVISPIVTLTPTPT